jgi:hypothetical protein
MLLSGPVLDRLSHGLLPVKCLLLLLLYCLIDHLFVYVLISRAADYVARPQHGLYCLLEVD